MTERRPVVMLVHGLWFGAWSMALLARRLRRAGFEVRRFRYRTTRAGFEAHAQALGQAVRGAGSPLHFVGHSLGGLVILRLLADEPAILTGRVALLGPPLQGSAVARRATRLPGGGHLLGAVQPVLEGGFDRLPASPAVGVIAGTRPLGLGWLVGGTRGPGDGTVAVAETRAANLPHHLQLPATHTGLLLSRRVARAVAVFLHTGRFDPCRS